MTYQAEQHINLLMSKSFCGHDVHENESTREHVLNAYKFLNSNPFLSCILMIVASSSKVKSVYDFKRDSVHIADPTVPSNTKGMFYLSGRVYIGAKQLLDESEKTEVYSTLAHEFCHYAMDLTYKNFAKPYAKNDNKTRQEFEEISQKCQQQQGFEEYIDIVYEHYPPEVQHAELIVRVPHLIALYSDQPERLREVREKFIELFEFYENKIFIEMQEALPKVEKLDQLEHEKREQKILKLRKIACFSFIFTLVAIILVIALTCLLNKKPIYNFKELSETYKLKVTNAPIIYKNIEVRFYDLFPTNSTAYYKLSSDHISQIVEGHALNFSDPHLSYLNELVRHDWKNLTEKLKDKFLTSNFTFQNESLKFQKLAEVNSEVFDSLSSKQIIDVLDGKTLVVGKMIEDKIDYYIERRFMLEDVRVSGGKYRIENEDERKAMEIRLEGDQVEELVYTEGSKEITQKTAKGLDSLTHFEYQTTKIDKNLVKNSKNSDEIIQEALGDRIFILSSDIGAGKTVIFQNLTIRLKKSSPTKWVSFIDLNNQIVCDNLKKLDKTLENNEKIENLVQFLSNILNLDRNNKSEAALLEKSFKLGNVVLLWDNFDLLSSEDREIITKIFNLIYKLTKNVQFISSMPLFTNQLKQSLNAKIYHPVPFTESEQKDYFRSFFNLQNLPKEKVESFTQGAFNISKTLQLDSPLMQRFIADIYESDKLYENPNFFNLILKFVTQKIENWAKSERGQNLLNYIISRPNFDMMKMYQKVAFEKELGFANSEEWYKNLTVLKTKIPKILQVDEIARMGILSYKSKTDYNFIHKTLADFFLAKYFIDNLYNEDDNVSKTGTELMSRAFELLLDDRREMVVTLIREYLKNKNDDKKTNQDFIKILNLY